MRNFKVVPAKMVEDLKQTIYRRDGYSSETQVAVLLILELFLELLPR
jgi:hypothetical protein